MPKSSRSRGNLPAEVNSFVGRRDDLARIRSQLATARHISLVGPGGVGKTRLAVRSARELARRFRDGAWIVELADVEDGALVGNAMLAALELRDRTATAPLALVLSYLRGKDLLLVMDNCEHVLDAAARVVDDLLKSASGVRVIATSREPLGLAGEQILSVRPLELPAHDPAYVLHDLRKNEAVALFTDRAAAAAGSFDVSAANSGDVAEICRRLDGLPLAIELAAVRTRAFSIAEIRDRLTDRFSLLTGGSRAALPRHQALLTAFEWSHDLLTVRERVLLRRLGVFPGRFLLEDVEAVCVGDDVDASTTRDLLASLIDKSLVLAEPLGQRTSYRQHETIREFARLKLGEAGEQVAFESVFVAHFLSLCGRSASEARYQLVEWLDWIDIEIENVRSVLQRSLSTGEVALGLRLATSLWWYWITRATTEGVRWLDTFLKAAPSGFAGQGWSLFIRGFLAVLQVDPTTAGPLLRRAVQSADATNQPVLRVQALSMASIAALGTGDDTSALQLLNAAEGAVSLLDDAAATLAVLQARSLYGLAIGDSDGVRVAASEGVRLSRDSGDLYALDMMLLNLGLAALGAEDFDAAKPLLVEGLRVAQQLDDRIAYFLWLDAIAYHAAQFDEAGLSARLMGAAHALRAEAGARVNPIVERLRASAETTARGALGETQFQTQFEAGSRLSRDAALDLALGKPSVSTHTDNPTSVLRKREVEVARLVAQGLTNKEIGTRLFISDRTVESHVGNILNKLALNSRVQIATWLSSRESSP